MEDKNKDLEKEEKEIEEIESEDKEIEDLEKEERVLKFIDEINSDGTTNKRRERKEIDKFGVLLLFMGAVLLSVVSFVAVFSPI